MAARAVTVSASYGAGGSAVAPAVAERLGLPFLDRAIPTEVAASLDVPVEQALARDERRPGLLDRMLSSLAGGYLPFDVPQVQVPAGAAGGEDSFLATTEGVLLRVAEDGGVVLGRGGAHALAGRPGVLHVRLDAERASRVAVVARVEGLDERAASRRVDDVDRARSGYVRHFYGADPADPRAYHLVLDVHRLGVELVVDLVLKAATALPLDAAGAWAASQP